jgi:hypothetical protein
MEQENQKITPILLNQCKEAFGEKSFETVAQMAIVLRNYLNGGNKFTGKIVFTVNCSNGGIGNLEAYIQKKI